jgi:hypothetical protein
MVAASSVRLLFGDLLRPVVEPVTGTSESGGPATDRRQVAG